MIAILVATRGMVFTETDILIDKVVNHFDSQVFRTFDKKIPDAQNYLVEEALKTEAQYFLFIEEDNVPTFEQVKLMVNYDRDISFIDYGVNGWSCSARKSDTEILWCGLGATLIKRSVFEKLKKPWFRTDKTLRLNDWKWIDNEAKYGGLDIWFFTKAKEAGFKIFQVPGECRHLKLDKLGSPETNNGLHIISDKKKIEKYQTIERKVK